MTVNTADDKRRRQYDIGIGYGDNRAEARKLIIEALREVESVLTDPAPEALVGNLAGSTVTIRVPRPGLVAAPKMAVHSLGSWRTATTPGPEMGYLIAAAAR